MEEGKGQSSGNGQAVGNGGDAAAVSGPHVSRNWELDMARKTSTSCWDFLG